VHVAIADSQTANGYGIFDLVLSAVHLNANERLISDSGNNFGEVFK
jgi:hypothetical protein